MNIPDEHENGDETEECFTCDGTGLVTCDGCGDTAQSCPDCSNIDFECSECGSDCFQ